MAVLLNPSEEHLKLCAQQLINRGLVAFPTETVYGLGGCILYDESIMAIYQLKGRPTSDPLIVHGTPEILSTCIRLNAIQENVYHALTKAFWPGPLTCVVPASSVVSKKVTAGSDWVGVRVPRHPIAEKLLALCNVPIAAPSANFFGHVSPSKPEHVAQEFRNCSSLLILDGGSCSVGIESTVIKIEEDGSLSLLRLGGLTLTEIRAVVGHDYLVNIVKKAVSRIDEQQASPGQLLTHYSPHVPSYIFSNPDKININDGFIDFNQRNMHLKNKVKWYVDLSEQGDPREAALNLYKFLRTAENLSLSNLLLVNLEADRNDILEAIFDRIFRACSGKYL